MSLLDSIDGPYDVRALPAEDLPRLAGEIRERLISQVRRSGGHLGPNLGVVELTIALHRVFKSPQDLIVFDTGHQAYVHKMLTGRADRLDTLRRAGGMSGYPNRAESVHDLVENSHASTALSYADGLTQALALRPASRHARRVVAVVGDGALTGGMAWEALNNIAAHDRPLVVLLNDNGRSYSPTIGGLARHLGELRTAPGPAAMFESLGLAYIGPIDGHDAVAVEAALTEATALGHPVVVHAVTRKGFGYTAAEDDARDHMHTVPRQTDAPARPTARNWTATFGTELVEVAETRDDIVAVTAAMTHPTGLAPLADRHPERVIDVGIAEQHAVTSAAGMAMGGLHPVVCIYATFLNRAFDQVLFDVALHRLPVTFVLDRAGITGEDGPSHHGMWDLSVFRVVPGLRVAVPRDATTLRQALHEAVAEQSGPTMIRFPKGTPPEPAPVLRRIAAGDVLREGADLLLVAVGPTATECLAAADALAALGIESTVLDPRWVLPVNPALTELAAGYPAVLTVEDGLASGGVGSAVAEALAERGSTTPVRRMGVPSRFVPHGSRGGLLAGFGLDAEGIVAEALRATTDQLASADQRRAALQVVPR